MGQEGKVWNWRIVYSSLMSIVINILISVHYNTLQRDILNLYCDERKDIQLNMAWAQGKSCGLRLYFIVFFDSSHNTDILNFKSSIGPPGRSILVELILRIASAAGQYGKILPSRLSNTGELNFNIIMLSNWECIRIRTRGGIYGRRRRRRGIFDGISQVES